MKIKYPVIYALLLMLTVVSACKKTIGLDALPQNLITEYKVSNIDGDIYGSINESNKTITVYLPVYYKLGVIDPEIKVSQGAKLSKESLPVKLDNKTVTYTVTAADQSTSTYKLTIVIQQQTPMFISYIQSDYKAPNTALQLSGNFFATDPKDIHVTLVNEKGKETAELEPYWSGYKVVTSGGITSLSSVNIPVDIEEGKYFVRTRVFSLTATSTDPIEIKYRQPAFNIFGITTKENSSFKILPGIYTIFKNFTSFTGVINGVTYNFPIVSYNATEATIQMPAELKKGSYFTTFTGTFTGFKNATQSAWLTVTD